MKKAWLSCLLAAILLLSLTACAFNAPDADNIPVIDPTTEAPTQEPVTPPTPSDPAALIGIWHLNKKATVFQFAANGSLTVYYLALGYFSYTETATGSYTYDGVNLSYTLSDGTTFTGFCSADAEQVTITNTAGSSQAWQLTPVSELPAEHPVYDFPNFKLLSEQATLPAGTYTGLTVDAKQSYLSAITQTIEQISSKQLSPTLKAEGTAALYDIVNIDYTGKLDGVAFSGGTAQGQAVAVGDGLGMIDGFGAQIAGHTVGETFDIDVTFPADYGAANLAGKAVVFTMTLNGIYEAAEEIDAAYQSILEGEIYTLIPGLSETEVSEDAYRFFLQYSLDNIHYYAFYYGYDYNTFLALNGMTEASILEDSKATARRYLVAYLLAAELGIEPDEDYCKEIYDSNLKSLMQNNGYTQEGAEEYLAGEGKLILEANTYMGYFADYLIQNNTITQTP